MENRFDDLAMTLAGGVSRRGALRQLIGVLGGVLFASPAFGAGPRRPARRRGRALSVSPPTCNQYCHDELGLRGTALADCMKACRSCTSTDLVCYSSAAGSYVCCSGACCGGECTDLATDVNNCGACGNVCPTVANGTAVCSGGQCGFICLPGFVSCGGGCFCETPPPNCQLAFCFSNGQITECGYGCIASSGVTQFFSRRYPNPSTAS